MKKHLYKFETTLWLFVKAVLYLSMMAAFIKILGRESIGLTRLSRMLGVTILTFVVVGLLFLSVYGKYDVGRRKSKPIIYSLTLTVICADIVTYLQLMIMRTNTPDVNQFRLNSLGLLGITMVVQILIIIFFAYAGNWLFFKFHRPEKCCVITSSQDSLDEIVFAIKRYQKQYEIASVLDYHSDKMKRCIRDVDTVFIYDVPVEARTDIMRWSYKYKVNVYFNPEIHASALDIDHYVAPAVAADDNYVYFINFTRDRSKKKVAHVGIYLKNGKFIHSSTSRGVIVSRLGEDYYSRHWICGGRIR